MPSASSIDVYISAVNSLQTAIENPPTDKYEFLKDGEKTIKYINEKYENINTKRTKINACLYFCKIFDYEPSLYKQELDRLFKLTDAAQTNVKTDKQEANWVDTREIDEKLKELLKVIPKNITDYDDYRKLINYIIILFHKHLPIRNDLADAKIVFNSKAKTDEEINYIKITNKKKREGILIMKKYKTKSTYGEKKIEIPTQIIGFLLKYEPVFKQFSPDGWFLPSRESQTKPITRNNYTKIFQSLFEGKKVGSTQFRRTAVSALHKPAADELVKKKQLADVMMHSVAVAGNTYAKAD